MDEARRRAHSEIRATVFSSSYGQIVGLTAANLKQQCGVIKNDGIPLKFNHEHEQLNLQILLWGES